MTAVTTILAFHAHPDDEVLFTGGTLAQLGTARVAHLGYADSGHGSVFGLLGGREWFTERDAAATTVSGDILAPAA